MCLVVQTVLLFLDFGNIDQKPECRLWKVNVSFFKAFGDVDAFTCIKSNDVDEIVNTIYTISGSFGE